ncbi:MAG: (2Fe-2S) ferredoxin domain-containing protein [Planctomycetota bacterium]
MADDSDAKTVRRTPPKELAPKFGVGKLTHHVFLCDGPACCDSELGKKAWGQLKRLAGQVNLDEEQDASLFVTRCSCLKFCDRGPIAVVYPDGTWYELADADVITRLIEEHVLGGKPVEEFRFATDDLGSRNVDRD